MAWAVRLESRAEKDLGRLDRQDAQRILLYLHERVANLDDPHRAYDRYFQVEEVRRALRADVGCRMG